jgi:hypothetical protein
MLVLLNSKVDSHIVHSILSSQDREVDRFSTVKICAIRVLISHCVCARPLGLFRMDLSKRCMCVHIYLFRLPLSSAPSVSLFHIHTGITSMSSWLHMIHIEYTALFHPIYQPTTNNTVSGSSPADQATAPKVSYYPSSSGFRPRDACAFSLLSA